MAAPGKRRFFGPSSCLLTGPGREGVCAAPHPAPWGGGVAVGGAWKCLLLYCRVYINICNIVTFDLTTVGSQLFELG